MQKFQREFGYHPQEKSTDGDSMYKYIYVELIYNKNQVTVDQTTKRTLIYMKLQDVHFVQKLSTVA